MRRSILAAVLVVGIGAVLGATVFREDIAAAAQNLNVFVTNDASNPVPVEQQGTAQVTVANTTPVTVDAGFETQLLLDRTVQNEDRVTLPVAAYKTIHVDFRLVSGGCAGSGARLIVVEATEFLDRGDIGADDACTGGFTGETIEMPGRSLTLIASIPQAGDTWRVVVFGRAN